MKKIRTNNNVFVIAKRSVTERKLDYYLQFPNRQEKYLFTRKYSAECYEKCKSGIPLNTLLRMKKRNLAVMRLVKYLKLTMPYFMEYYELEKTA